MQGLCTVTPALLSASAQRGNPQQSYLDGLMKLRDYRDTDIPAILLVIKEAFAEFKGQLDPPSSAERKTIAIVRAELQSANALVVEADGKIVGCVFFRPQGIGIYIDRLSVLPAYRNRGIASAMLKEIECRARSTGYKTLMLSVRLVLEKQQAYYSRLGFEFQEYGTHQGHTKPTYMKMRKDIDGEKGRF